jgi:hypothetical protein
LLRVVCCSSASPISSDTLMLRFPNLVTLIAQLSQFSAAANCG